MKVAILGATSHIAKNLAHFFWNDSSVELFMFARNIEALQDFLRSFPIRPCEPTIKRLDAFLYHDDYDVIINCVGIADPMKQKTAGLEIFQLTESFDNLILEYLRKHRDTQYLNFSSGAVYGTAFDYGVEEKSQAVVSVNDILPGDYYRIAKINSEAKHRAMHDSHIIDIRIFSFFSRYINIDSGFLLSEVLRCLRTDSVFVTNSLDISRDYIAPSDLFSLIQCCMKNIEVNGSFDAYSAGVVRKSELLNIFASNFGLKLAIDDSKNPQSITGHKMVYYSNCHKAGQVLGYFPLVTSVNAVVGETKAYLSGILI